jgi:glycosyltransferase involved in cell wall biosynthesis
MATLPVVATRVGGIPEVIVDQETGLLVPPDEVVPLADAITSLLENPERGALLAKNLHEKVVAEFSEKDMVEKTFALY